MAIANASDESVQQVRERRLWFFEQLSASFLCHLLSKAQQRVLETVSDTRLPLRPGNIFLNSPVSRALHLARAVYQIDADTVNGKVAPNTNFLSSANDFAAPTAFGAAAPVLVRLDQYLEDLVVIFEF
jgi:hypothetical protein